MKRSRPPRRGAPPKRSPLPRRRQTVRPWLRAKSPNDFPSEVRAIIRARSGGRCEARCAPNCTVEAMTVHHRQPRELGDQRAVNGLDCCYPCHGWIHTQRNAEARRRGLIVSRWADAAEVPVTSGLIP